MNNSIWIIFEYSKGSSYAKKAFKILEDANKHLSMLKYMNPTNRYDLHPIKIHRQKVSSKYHFKNKLILLYQRTEYGDLQLPGAPTTLHVVEFCIGAYTNFNFIPVAIDNANKGGTRHSDSFNTTYIIEIMEFEDDI